MKQEAEATKKCHFCGEEILAIANKCKHCGASLAVSPDSEIKEASNFSYKKLLKPLLIITALSVILGISVFITQPTTNVAPDGSRNICQYIKYGSPTYGLAMNTLFKMAGEEAYGKDESSYKHDETPAFGRDDEYAKELLCEGDLKSVQALIDRGSVDRKTFEVVAAIIESESKPSEGDKFKSQSFVGKMFQNAEERFNYDLGLCSACASNAAHYIVYETDSPCGALALEALDGYPEALKKLNGNMDSFSGHGCKLTN